MDTEGAGTNVGMGEDDLLADEIYVAGVDQEQSHGPVKYQSQV